MKFRRYFLQPEPWLRSVRTASWKLVPLPVTRADDFHGKAFNRGDKLVEDKLKTTPSNCGQVTRIRIGIYRPGGEWREGEC
jgi:hypothetical protein